MTAQATHIEIDLDDFEVEIFEDETSMFVADTLDAVREAASMNEKYVPSVSRLPMGPLPKARPMKPPLPATSPRHKVAYLDREVVLRALPTPVDPILLQPRPEPVRPRRWPVLLCGFIASVFAGMALMQSPVGPRVYHGIAVAKAMTLGR